MQWFIPECAQMRAQYAEAMSIIQPVLDQRQADKRAAAAAGEPIPSFNDAIDWAEEESHRVNYVPAAFQLSVPAVAIHTTADLLWTVLVNLVPHPKLVQDLRDEIVQSLGAHGWTKQGLDNMKLMDSVLKESQRIKPMEMCRELRNTSCITSRTNTSQ